MVRPVSRLKFNQMAKFQVTIEFDMTDDFLELVPEHRNYVNHLINEGLIDHYAVSMETLRSWVTINAEDKDEVIRILRRSPLYKYWTYEIDELFVLDGQSYRLPELHLN